MRRREAGGRRRKEALLAPLLGSSQGTKAEEQEYTWMPR
jgi:hypothetical protein